MQKSLTHQLVWKADTLTIIPPSWGAVPLSLDVAVAVQAVDQLVVHCIWTSAFGSRRVGSLRPQGFSAVLRVPLSEGRHD